VFRPAFDPVRRECRNKIYDALSKNGFVRSIPPQVAFSEIISPCLTGQFWFCSVPLSVPGFLLAIPIWIRSAGTR
jgi:hypothetical protein